MCSKNVVWANPPGTGAGRQGEVLSSTAYVLILPPSEAVHVDCYQYQACGA